MYINHVFLSYLITKQTSVKIFNVTSVAQINDINKIIIYKIKYNT